MFKSILTMLRGAGAATPRLAEINAPRFLDPQMRDAVAQSETSPENSEWRAGAPWIPDQARGLQGMTKLNRTFERNTSDTGFSTFSAMLPQLSTARY